MERMLQRNHSKKVAAQTIGLGMIEAVPLLLCSHEPILAAGLTSLLSQASIFDPVFYRPSAEDLCSQVKLHQPDILLIDLTAEITFRFLRELQDLPDRTKVILWVHSISTELAMQAMNFGVSGILRRTVPFEILLRCLARVNKGGLWFEQTLTRRAEWGPYAADEPAGDTG